MTHEAYIRHVAGSSNVVLFIHGFLGSPRHFDTFVEEVPETYAVYNILLRGHGGSVRDFANASMEMWKNQVDGVVKELVGRYQNIIIVAHSMGTFFAMDAAIKYPDRVAALFLLGMPLEISVQPTAAVNTLKSFFNLHSEQDTVGKAYREAHSVMLNKRVWEYIGWIPRYLELFAESKKSRSTILEVNTPCYIFQSAKDELVSMKSMDYIPDKPNMHVRVLQNSAHFIYSDEDFSHMKSVFRRILEQN